jgi:hypothetical protein
VWLEAGDLRHQAGTKADLYEGVRGAQDPSFRRVSSTPRQKPTSVKAIPLDLSRQSRRPVTDPSEPDGTVLDLDGAVVAAPDGAVPTDALFPDAVRTGPWPDLFHGLTTTYPLSPPTRRSPLRAGDVPIRAVTKCRVPKPRSCPPGHLRMWCGMGGWTCSWSPATTHRRVPVASSRWSSSSEL